MDFPEKIVVATRNPGKLAEIRAIMREMPIDWRSLEDFPQAPEAGETSDSYLENAREKARLIAEHSGSWVLADDSGLEVEALNGLPGVRSARYAGEAATDQENNGKLLQAMQGLPRKSRRAQFRCVLVLLSPEGREWTSEGILEGEIAELPAGDRGFGYDPVFFLPERGRTLAQLEASEKNSLSHRRQALRAMKDILLKNLA